jgi:hypothetical protein
VLERGIENALALLTGECTSLAQNQNTISASRRISSTPSVVD